MATSISSLLIECFSFFNAQVARDELVAHDAEVPQSLWLDELGRLRVWAANIGAHQVGQSSLDYRLRDASHIKDQIIRLLERLQRLLVDLKEALSDPPEGAEDQFSDDEDIAELEQIYNGFVEVISSLFQMSMLIRRPARHDRLLGAMKEDSVIFEPYDRQHVLEKYPRVDAIVGDRLGRAISRRRADLKYRERHNAKLSQGINHVQIAGNKESHSIHDRESTVFSDTIATEYKEPNILFDETGSHSGVSQTSYAPTLLEGGNAITVPPPPKESANEQPFECPYCFFITTIKNKRSWARHVFRDIMPYVRIFAGCSTPNRLYDSRREWYEHLTDSHISPSSAGELHECALCREAGFSTLSLERHLGRHLEELALFALPRSVGDDDIDSDRSRHSSRQHASSHKASPDSSSDEAEDEAIELVTSSAEHLPAGDISVAFLGGPQRLEELAEHLMKCICTCRDSDGKVVHCDNCETWQHVECYYPNQNIPELHLCADCEPRPLDRKAATERRKYRGEQPDEIVEAIEEHTEFAKRVLDQGKLGKMPSSTGDSETARDDDDVHRSKAAPAASSTSGYTETDEIAIETDDDFDSKADDGFAMSSTGDESDGGSKIRHERIRAPTLRASQYPEEPLRNDDRLGSTRDSSSFEESHADRPLSRTPRPNTPVEDQDPDGSYFSTSPFHPQGESGAHGGEKSQGPMSGLKRFFGFGASKDPKTEVATSSTSSMDRLGIPPATTAEYRRFLRRSTVEAEPKEMALDTTSNQLTGQDTDVAPACLVPNSIADTALGLSSAELQILRQQQQLLVQNIGRASKGGRPSKASRSNLQAGPAQPGRILLDANSLARLNAQFEALLRNLQTRIDVLQNETEAVTTPAHNGLNTVNSIAKADAEIARMRNIIAQIDELEGELDKVGRIKDIIGRLRLRIEDMESKIRPIAQAVTG